MQKKSSKAKKVSKFANNQIDFILCITILLLLSLGIIMVLSASAPASIAEGNGSYVSKQALFAVVGIALMIFISKIDYRFYKKNYWMVYFVSWIILIFVAIPGLGLNVNGATRWISLGFIQFQPSEITKIGMIIFYAGYLSDHKKDLQTFWKGFVLPFAFLAPPILILFFIQSHLSASVVIASITAIMMLMAGARVLYFAIIGGTCASGILGLLGIMQMSGGGGFRLARIKTFFDPWQDAQGVGYQVVQSLYAIGSGGLLGAGLRRK